MKLLKKLYKIYKQWWITKSDIRDFRIVMIASILNISFAIEKLFIVIWNPLKDIVWLFIYGALGLYLMYIAIVDYIHDEIEEEPHNTNSLL